MKAIFPGTCAACNRAIQRGDELVDSGRRGPRGGKVMVHAGCSARKNPLYDEGLVRCVDCGSVVPDEAMAGHMAQHRVDRAFQHRGPARPGTKKGKTRRDDATWWVTGQTGPVMHRDVVDVVWSKKNPKSLMIPLPFPESAYRYGPDPDLASWTVDPEYSYQQFARENPGVFRVTGRAIPVPANHPYARRLQDQLRAKMNAERFSTPEEAQALLAEVKASYLFDGAHVTAKEPIIRRRRLAQENPRARKNFFWGKSAEKKVERRISGAERELMEFRDRVQAEIHKLEGEAKQTAMVREALEDRRSLLSHLDGRLAEFARPNGLGRPVYSEVPHNAGPYVPQLYPFGSFGRPATYTTEPPKAKKNPIGDAFHPSTWAVSYGSVRGWERGRATYRAARGKGWTATYYWQSPEKVLESFRFLEKATHEGRGAKAMLARGFDPTAPSGRLYFSHRIAGKGEYQEEVSTAQTLVEAARDAKAHWARAEEGVRQLPEAKKNPRRKKQ